ncbi:hypothetical protein BDN67DRAFT_979615 [Paxillus ammoniavirescens]|nr:hypothetical protein BDN67DRAFT_979615 [Paxillus ammoniavirescens]
MEQNDLYNSTIDELYQETTSVCPLPDISSIHLSPLPTHTVLKVTPSATTVTLPTTPEGVHAQLAGVEYHNPPRFIFYPISWDGYESPPPSARTACSTQNTLSRLDVPADLEGSNIYVDYHGDDWPDPACAAFCPEDAFRSIDRWRRNIIKHGGTTRSQLLEPIQDADTWFSLLSFPHDQGAAPGSRSESAGWEPFPFHSSAGGDEILLWVHPVAG